MGGLTTTALQLMGGAGANWMFAVAGEGAFVVYALVILHVALPAGGARTMLWWWWRG